MIEGDILNWVDLGETMQYLDVYAHRTQIKFFNLIRVLMSYKSFGLFFYLFFYFFDFLQILMLLTTNIDDKKDSTLVLLKYIKSVVFIQDFVKSKGTFFLSLIVLTFLAIFIILLIIYMVISIRIKKFYMQLPIFLLNFSNIFLMDYLIAPIVQITLGATNCPNGIHIYLQNKCYQDLTHIFFFVISILLLIFFVGYSIILSIYYNEIGTVSGNKLCGRINCSYEFYSNLMKIVFFSFAYYLKNYQKENKTFRFSFQITLFIFSFLFSIYCYKTVYFYDRKTNTLIQYAWTFIAWSSFVIIIKCQLNIYDTSLYHIMGWIIFSSILYLIEENKEEYLLTDFNIFDNCTLKEIELFNAKLFNLISVSSIKNKTILIGIKQKFEKFFKTNPEMKDKYIKLTTNEILLKQYTAKDDLNVLAIMLLIYDYHLEKSKIKNDILLSMCYFLLNKFKKAYLALSLCSKIKITNHRMSYFKFKLMEEIKEYLIFKITKSNNSDNIKHIQIGSVILYYIYIDLFKLKIYDAACNQIDYFDNLRNSTASSTTTKHFLSIGKTILQLRTEILKIWNKILELNPFSDESERDYMLYLETIMQDDILAKTEKKRFENLKSHKLSERTNVYHSMFIKDLSSVCLIDGYNIIGKILYTSPNFSNLFGFNQREISNYTINDMMPNIIASYHNDLIDNSVKYSNFSKIFKKPINALIKGKMGGIYNVKIFIKCMPNFNYGLIYISYIQKNADNSFIIILDEDFNINCYTDVISSGGEQGMLNNSYGLNQSIINRNIGVIIPEIMKQIEYKNDKFVILKTEIDLEGTLYPVSGNKEIDVKVAHVYDKIKLTGKITLDEEGLRRDSIKEYEELIHEITSKYQKGFSIFYKVMSKSFLDGKHVYHRIYVTNDLIALNEKSNFYNSVQMDSGNETINGNSESRLSEGEKKFIKLQGIGFDSERKTLLKPENSQISKNDNDIKNNNNKDNNKKNNIQDKNNEIKDDLNSSASISKPSVETSQFNKLKNSILTGKEVTSFKVMRYLGYIYGLTTMLLIYLNYIIGKNTLDDIYDYLDENLVFNHSKIAVSCILFSSKNLNLAKYNLINQDNCYVDTNCNHFYLEILSKCLKDLETTNENSSYYYNDFLKTLSNSLKVDLSIYYTNVKSQFNISKRDLLTLIVSTGLDFCANINSFFNLNYTIYDVMNTNLQEESFLIINDQDFSGYEENKKRNKVNDLNLFQRYFPIFIEIVLFFVFTCFFIFLIYKVNHLENIFLTRLINFKSPSFEIYIKSLDTLKSHLRSDEEESEKNDENLLLEDKDEESSEKKEEENEKGKKGKKGKNDKKREEQNEHKKKNKEKIQKMRVLKNQKIKAMTSYFLHNNIFFIIRVMFVFLFSLSYFILTFVLEKKNKNHLLKVDSAVNSVEGIYKTSYDNFFSIKSIIEPYLEYEIKRNQTIFRLSINDSSIIEFYGKNYTSKDIEEIKNLKNNQFIFNSNKVFSTPKIGNLLMSLINDNGLDKKLINRLNTLYSGDSCSILFENSSSSEYSICSNFWSSILVKGMEQSITQMSVVLNTVIDELNSVKNGIKKVEDIISKGSAYNQFEFFVEYYLLLSYWESSNIFNQLKTLKIDSIFKIYLVIMIAYFVVSLIMIIFVIKVVYSSRDVLNSFLNFIGIFPIKYIIEDSDLTNVILKLEGKLY